MKFAFCIDQNYSKVLFFTPLSILQQVDNPKDHTFIFISEEPLKGVDEIRTLLEFKGFNTQYIILSRDLKDKLSNGTYGKLNDFFKNYVIKSEDKFNPKWITHLSISAFDRIFIPEIIEGEVVYLDPDIFFRKDPTVAYSNLVSNETPISLAVNKLFDKEAKTPDDLELVDTLNTGVIIYNCDQLKKEKFVGNIFKFIQQNMDEMNILMFRIYDEVVITSFLFKDMRYRINILPLKYNFINIFLIFDYIYMPPGLGLSRERDQIFHEERFIKELLDKRNYDHEQIICYHYAGPGKMKPWAMKNDNFLSMYSLYQRLKIEAMGSAPQ